MSRISRMVSPGEETIYHVISRVALDGFPLGEIEKDELLKIIKQLNSVYFSDIFGFCILGDHFHLLIKIHPGYRFADKEIRKRFASFYGDKSKFPEDKMDDYRDKWGRRSEFLKEAKQRFSRFYNKLHNRRGTLWGERFKSVIVEEGKALVSCLAYIDLNPIRAGIVKRPEDYRWSSLGHHAQSGNRDGFLSTDFGLPESGAMNEEERVEEYRRFVYDVGALNRPNEPFSENGQGQAPETEQDDDPELIRTRPFTQKNRYFSDSGIIGSKAFVMENYQRFKGHFQSKREKRPKPIKGIEGVFSLKRLNKSV